MKYYGRIESIEKLSETDIKQMFKLMNKFFDGIIEAVFREDLLKKSGIIIIRDQNDLIKGFSTFRLDYEDFMDALVLFSGDTVIHRDVCGSNLLFQNFGKILDCMMKIQEGECIPDEVLINGELPQKKISHLYWFLISKGIRTYLMLPLFFRSYYPGIKDRVNTSLGLPLRELAEKRFPDEWNPSKGILEIQHDRLKKELARIPPKMKGNKHVAYFLERNPFYTLGNELACLTEITMENIQPGARRFVSFCSKDDMRTSFDKK